MPAEFPVSVVSHSIPEFFLQDLPPGFETFFRHLTFGFRQGPEHQFCQNLGPGGDLPTFLRIDATVFKPRTIRTG